MESVSDELLNADIHDLKRGYKEDVQLDAYTCLVCGHQTEKGIVYPEGGVLYEAEKSMRRHIQQQHHSMLDYLLSLDKKMTGLTDLQRKLIGYFHQGLSDHDIIAELDGGSTSTIRNHRFMLREKMKQAKLFLTVMELMEEGGKSAARTSIAASKQNPSKLPGALGGRLMITEDEYKNILSKYFTEGPGGPLSSFPKQEKRRIAILRHIAGDFEEGRTYTEKEVNQVLEARFEDYVTLRRLLIEYGFLDREPDGSEYWAKQPKSDGKGKKNMKDQKRRKELVNEYMNTPRPMGVFQIRNKQNGKIYVTSSTNMPGAFNSQKAKLASDYHVSPELQRDWKELGEDAFAFEILEELRPDPQSPNDLQQQRVYKDKVAKMEKEWLEKLQPYDEKGYNRRPRAK